ncbi:MAG: AarF/ABC1/UbiB kinase family protein [Nitrospiraceae bacterium]|nr:MAG: AarF/ABC1/UbiB kinase family protein [Nitrospiraceae bacterium]
MAITNLVRYWQTYKNIKRIRHIVNVFLRHGFGQFIERVNLQRFVPLSKRFKFFSKWEKVEKHTIPERLRMAFSGLGPSFIKLAQILSSRPDLITGEYAEEFKKLQDKVPPFSSEKAVQIIESELRVNLEDVFSDFDEIPVAAASIAQVHYATLKTGEKVIVKVQRPDIRQIIQDDLTILSAIARLMVKYIPESRLFDPEGIVNEFSKTVRKELDFVAEAKNAQRFKRSFTGDQDICIPTIYSHLLTEKVIVMERFEGVRIDDIGGIDALGINRRELAQKGVNAYFKMIFEDGFFHADPHPGNIFVMPDGKIGLMDFGIVGWLAPDIMESIAGAFLALYKRKFDDLIDAYLELGVVAGDVDIEEFRRELKADLVEILEPLYDLTISEVNFPEYLELLTHLVIKHGLKVPSELMLINKTILILDNIGRQLDPGFNAVTAAAPYAAKLVKRRLSPKSIFEKTKDNLLDMHHMLLDMPKQINRLLRKSLRDEVGININPIGMDKLIRDIDRSSNRLAFSIIVAAIIVGSSVLIQSNVGGKILGMPTVGAIGFLVAFVLGLGLLISIIRSGRL